MVNHHQASSIIDEYEQWTPEIGVDALLELRQRLSIAANKIGNEVRVFECNAKNYYMKRKIAEATTKLTTEGTILIREARAITINKQLRLDEGNAEGEAQGGKIYLNTVFKVLDSMASYIHIMRGI